MSALTKEIRALIATGMKDTALAQALSNEHVTITRHQARKLIDQYKLEQAAPPLAASTSNWAPAATREEWFIRVVAEIEGTYEAENYKVPKLRIGCGWMSGGKRSKAMGECWESTASAEGMYNIFINPRLNTGLGVGEWVKEHEEQHHEGDLTVIQIVIHEVHHAVLWHNKCEIHEKAPHGKTFQKLCALFNMEMLNKRGATKFTEQGLELGRKISEKVGPYPMAPIMLKTTAKPTQTTRQVKVMDPDDASYFVRMTRDMINKRGLPKTPLGFDMIIDPFSALRTKYTQEEVDAKTLAFKSDEGEWIVTKAGDREARKIIDEIINGKDVAVCEDIDEAA